MRLFGTICDAVHYAHQRGVIHRDLKPSNILVTADGRPKVLDFGLARITDPDAEVTMRATEPGAIMGTLAYMSPEQARGRADDIDTRSDVYSLGVILYELLAGRLPYDLKGLTLPEAARIICEQAPPAPGALDGALRGDLETIVLKAIEKDAERRYDSAAALSEDLRRFLDNQPIQARPPSVTYQMRKLMARHKLPFVFAATLALVVIASAIATGWLALRFARQRDLARGAQTREADELEKAEQYATFLETLFDHADPAAVDYEPSLRQVMDDGYERLGEAVHPLVRARLMTVMGKVYKNLSEYERSKELLESALSIRRQALGKHDPDVAETLLILSALYSDLADNESATAAALEALDLRRRVFGDEHELVAQVWNRLGAVHFYAGDNARAANCFRAALSIRRSIHQDAHPEVAESMANLGRALRRLGETAEAEALLREALTMRQEIGDVPETLKTMEGLGMFGLQTGHPRGGTDFRRASCHGPWLL